MLPADSVLKPPTLLACKYGRAIVSLAAGRQSVTLRYTYADEEVEEIARAYNGQCSNATDVAALRGRLFGGDRRALLASLMRRR